MLNPTRVARRWIEASMLQAPPAMIESITEWVEAVLAADNLETLDTEIAEARQYRETHGRLLQPILTAAKDLEDVLGTAGSRALYKAYKSLYDLKVYSLGYGGMLNLSFKEFTGLDKVKQERLERTIREQIENVRNLVETHLSWGEQKLPELEKERHLCQRQMIPGVKGLGKDGSARARIPVNLKGWKYGEGLVEQARAHYLRNLDDMMKDVKPGFEDMVEELLEGTRRVWGAIWVKLETYDQNKKYLATWQAASKTLTLKVPYGGSLNRAHINLVQSQLRESLEHELQHMGQSLMTEALATADGSIRLQTNPATGHRLPSPGMPSRHIMTPQWNTEQEGRAHGQPRPGDPLGNEMHALDDIEFYTDLKGAIRDVQRVLDNRNRTTRQYQDRDMTEAERRALVHALVGSKVPREMRDFVGHQSPQRFFWTLKQHAPGKYQKAVAELWDAVQ